jgi:hypothetical protein
VRSTHHPKVLRTIFTEPGAGFSDAVDARTNPMSRPSPYPAARDKGQTG